MAGNIPHLLEYRNYTQEYVEGRLSISQNAYSKMGYTRITVERLCWIAIDADVGQFLNIIQFADVAG